MEQDNQVYQGLARKYRPQNFASLIGQDALVRTLSNAIKSGRLPQAILLSGTRGIGKTTTARIIAMSLNCLNTENPTTEPCGKCSSCTEIASSRHQDVLEMDAASHTSVNDIREVIENAKYSPLNARYKVFIIDEVHMLSNSAFNALLKTLEEPPQNVIFIFATTEIRKIPITIISRCQRFELKRLSAEDLAEYYSKIVAKEGQTAEVDAIKLIAKAADGSVRDGLSILDQALSLSQGNVTSEVVRNMLGLSPKDDSFEILHELIKGNVPECLEKAKSIHALGANPHTVLNDMLELTHELALAKFGGQDITVVERPEHQKLAQSLSVPFLSRLWQMLHKGLEEMKVTALPQECLEMILIRVAFANTSIKPEEIIKQSQGSVTKSSSFGNTSGSSQEGNPPISHNAAEKKENTNDDKENVSDKPTSSVERLLQIMYEHDDMLMYHRLKNDVSIHSINGTQVHLKVLSGQPVQFIGELEEKLKNYTGKDWQILHKDNSEASMSHAQIELQQENEKKQSIQKDPLVKDILNTFTEIEITDIKTS